MNQKVLRTLEYNKIVERLAEYAFGADTKERCLSLLPSTSLSEITNAQQQTKDAMNRSLKKGRLDCSGIKPLSSAIRRVEIGGTMNIEELLGLCKLLETARRVKAYGRKEREDFPSDSLSELFDGLEPLSPLCDEIRRCIISVDEISDDASSNLKSIRRSIRSTGDRIHAQLNQMLNNQNVRNCLQDFVITMRNGRYCLPVKAEAKSQITGMVHDQSSSGSTLFIEPMAVVNLNNELKELSIKEQDEIAVILATLSAKAGEYIPAIETDYQILTELDFIFAKAAYALEYNGITPHFNTERKIRILKGRHPLLDAKKVVPIDISLGSDFDQLVITGPNTGGKTVSLKTVGLLTLMGQAGLPIPSGDRSELAVFDNIFADIGDEQSIEQNLSTFSSHMTNIIHILKEANEHSLVLFDELCAGTDPTEGAALAVSILSYFHSRGIRTMATTHYSEIKIYALTTSGIENACCEFNVETLSPTYRLLIGIPGKSNAFAISKKLGLSDTLIEDARTRISSNEQNFEDLLSDLEASRITIEKEQAEINRYKSEIAALKQQLKNKQEKLDESRDAILRKAKEEANQILQEAKDTADEAIRNFNKYGTTRPSIQEMEKQRTNIREKMAANEKKSSKEKDTAIYNPKVPKKLRIGDSVKVLSMNLTGTVHSLPNAKGDLFVQMGILRSQVNIKDLVLIEDAAPGSKKYAKTGAGKLKMSKSASVSTEINLIGKTVDEAIALLDKYLDDAYLAHLPSVRIVHGKGTGALRSAVQSHLKRQSYIKSFHLGEFGEGDAGVTIAEFK
ncbi:MULTISPECIES: endonuclease MutS2 [unclassified Roseburia]|uniref:endonuclease MutS2 n=1 Tax=unclassified Roseburia TaxID=2637578 RepID=UPI000E46D49F|nr:MULTISPECIES: endonuclease MutS2 [unclassified Roseburia]RHQ38638.1 endonuclease MutS2 [Roseburia sp. AF25-25LB]RHQ40527.1 endonuclease MutS2 [Roseburia sp. AF25-18LB]RHQ46307.1 endonuclease MutS2 [Roseburia sp. AF25-15LB]RHQ46423.1 endonuclease MutS2 [Roseburia sp. AF25-13LB]